ncbi:hypothetical protein BGZ46_005746 [Entomortierella lignicola]|nr:hypothetical protein BGZ46_005746 [Entomortierella lignicola]
MIRDIDSQEVQSALTPSPTTGVTLASTIEEKINHVEEKIKVSKRIIKEGQLNLSRLRYEIELEQRSIRLFRQYKIVITVVTFSIVFVFWFLYHSRMNVHSSQPSPPLFRSSVNPFKTNYHFHHGGPIVSTPPASTCTISVHDNAKIDKDKT